MGSEETRDKILRAFLALAAERGMAGITTRDIAAAAGVNEVTLFRHFGDKASLARAAVRRFDPAAALDAYDPAIDASTPQAAMAGLLRCLSQLQSQLADHPELLQFGLGEAARYPELLEDLQEIPAAARRTLTRAFEQAAGQLRPEVSIDAEGNRPPRHAAHARDLAIPALGRPQRSANHRSAHRAPAAPVSHPASHTPPLAPKGAGHALPTAPGRPRAARRGQDRRRCGRHRPHLGPAAPPETPLPHTERPCKPGVERTLRCFGAQDGRPDPVSGHSREPRRIAAATSGTA